MPFLSDLSSKVTSSASTLVSGAVNKFAAQGINAAAGAAKNLLSTAAGQIPLVGGLAGGLVNSVSGRLTAALGAGTPFAPLLPGAAAATPTVTFAGASHDWRVRISVSTNAKILYRVPGGIMDPLNETDGFIFPYVPTVRVNHLARYGSQPLTHTNYNNYFYEGSEVTSILISGEFSVQSARDAKYFMAAVYFFRAATKMFYGDSGTYQGAPPPIVYLDGYGQHYLPHVPCVITNFAHSMPGDVDYVPITAAKNNFPDRVPTLSTFEVTLQPVYSRSRQREFNYDSFAAGEMIDRGML